MLKDLICFFGTKEVVHGLLAVIIPHVHLQMWTIQAAEFISSPTLLGVHVLQLPGAGRSSDLTDGGFGVDISPSLPLFQATTGCHILLPSS